MKILLVGLFLTIVLAARLTNRDLFSPAKFYLISFLMFFGAAATEGVSEEVYLLVMLVLSIGAFAMLLEVGRLPAVSRSTAASSGIGERRAVRSIWMFTAVPLLAQAYLINLSGGLGAFASGYSSRVLDWRGSGWAVTLMLSVTALNLMYLAIGLLSPRRLRWWLWFAVHLMITFFITSLSGSRGAILGTFATQLMLFNYLGRPVKLSLAVGVAASLLMAALVLGVVRERISWSSYDATDIISMTPALNLASFSYGTQPLQLIVDADPRPLAHGTTFLSVLTNPIPRSWWPGKFDSGGIFLTKAYADDAWGGASNLTPTFLGEWVINFDWALGIPGYVVSASLLTYLLFRHYRWMLYRVRGPRTVDLALDVVVYVYVLWAIVALMVGEVTNVIVGLMLTRLAPVMALRLAVRLRPRGQAQASSPTWRGLPAYFEKS